MFEDPSRPQKIESADSFAADTLLAAAERDAAEIVAQARTDVARAIVKARHDLIVLTSQLTAGLDLTRARPGEISPREQASAAARRNLLQALDDARPDLEGLAAAVRVIGRNERTHETASREPELEFSMNADAAATRWRMSRQTIAVVLVAAVIVMTLGFWVGLSAPSTAIPQPAANDAAGLAGDADGGAARGTSSSPEPDTSVEATAGLTVDPGSPKGEILRAAERWLEAYYAGDRTMMAVLSTAAVTIKDERGRDERLPPGLTRVARTLGEPNVQVFGSEALLTAKMIERSPGTTGPSGESVSFISQLWTHRAGAWRLTEARLVSPDALQRAFRR